MSIFDGENPIGSTRESCEDLTECNRIETLIDGVEIFSRIKEDLDAVDNSGFIYLAFWQFHPDLVVDQNSKQTIGQLLSGKANSTTIRILLWDFYTTMVGRALLSPILPGWGDRLMDPLYLRRFINRRLYDRLMLQNAQITVDDTYRWVQQNPNIDLIIAPYPDLGTGIHPQSAVGAISLGSHHQKLVIVNRPGDDGQRHLVAYVLGTNATNAYVDDNQHEGRIASDPWHDAGVRVLGPAALQVEREFVRRWNLNRGLTHVIDRIRQHEIQSCEIQNCFCEDNENETDNKRARLFVTSSQQREIRSTLIDKIFSATQSIYIEEQYFFDCQMFDALIESYLNTERAEGRRLKMALLTNNPNSFKVDGRDTEMTLYCFFNFKSLQLCSCDSIQVGDNSYNRNDGEDWRLTPVENGQLLPRQGYRRWDVNNLGFQCQTAGRIIQINEIANIEGGIFPAYIINRTHDDIYVHSKLSIIDDEYTIIGSANYSNRSMNYDSEASIMIHDSELATNLRRRLFAEMDSRFQASNVQEEIRLWNDHARENANEITEEEDPVYLIRYPDEIPDMRPMANFIATGISPPQYHLEQLRNWLGLPENYLAITSSIETLLYILIERIYPLH